jgi:hypothetical protein
MHEEFSCNSRSVRDSGYGIAIAHIPGKAEARKFSVKVCFPTALVEINADHYLEE